MIANYVFFIPVKCWQNINSMVSIVRVGAKMQGQLRMLNFACAAKARPRTVILTRPSRDEGLEFRLTGGHQEKRKRKKNFLKQNKILKTIINKIFSTLIH